MFNFTERVQAVQNELDQTDYLVNCCVELLPSTQPQPKCIPTTARMSVFTTLPVSALKREVIIEPTIEPIEK